jgi:hypothetical protein
MMKRLSRRRFFHVLATTVGGIAAWAGGVYAETKHVTERSRPSSDAPRTLMPPGAPGKHYTPVITPNGWTLPYKIVDGVKVFHLTAEPVPLVGTDCGSAWRKEA